MGKRIKVFVAASEDTPDVPGVFQIKHSGEFAARRFIPHITGFKNNPELISKQCHAFRAAYELDYSGDLAGTISFPSVLPELIDDVSTYLKTPIPPHDVLVALGVHPDILTELLRRAADAGCKALIAPREDPTWIHPSFLKTIVKICEQRGLEYAFPKPFCSLSLGMSPVIDAFIRQFRIGRPRYHLTLDEDQRVTQVKVECSSPCGATYHVAQGLIGLDKQKVVDGANKLWHTYPCLSSGKIDPELKDSIMHLGGYINIASAREALKKAQGRKGNVN